MRSLLASSLAVVLLAAPTDPAAAERNRWEQRGPSAASVTRIVLDPSSDAIAYCVANGGVYETLNGGRRWVSRATKIGDPALDGLAIYDVAPLRSEPRVLLAAMATDVVFKSTDGGRSWFVRRTERHGRRSGPVWSGSASRILPFQRAGPFSTPRPIGERTSSNRGARELFRLAEARA